MIAAYTHEEVGPLLAIHFFLFALLISLAYALEPAFSCWIPSRFRRAYRLTQGGLCRVEPRRRELGGILFNEVWGLVAAAWLVWLAWKVPKADA